MERVSHRAPALLPEGFERSGTQSPGIEHERRTALHLFEITCRLLYVCHPSKLVPFITFCTRLHTSTSGSSTDLVKFFEHAARSLPNMPSEHHSTQAGAKTTDSVLARAAVLQRAKDPRQALALLLRCKLWPQAITLVHASKLLADGTTHLELARKLTVGLVRGNVIGIYANELFATDPPVVPSNYRIADLLDNLSTRPAAALPADASPHPLGSEQQPGLTVGSLRATMLRMLERAPPLTLKGQISAAAPLSPRSTVLAQFSAQYEGTATDI